MPRYQNISSIFLLGIIFNLFIESFYNIIVDINAYIFMNFSEILTIMPTLVIAASNRFIFSRDNDFRIAEDLLRRRPDFKKEDRKRWDII
jgi:hypothetical protein